MSNFLEEKKSGSVLIFTLVILLMMLSVAIGITTATISERKNASTSDSSVQAFQVADSGAEIILRKIYKDDCTSLNRLTHGCDVDCSDGVVTGDIGDGNNYKIIFKDIDNELITRCNDPETIGYLKSVGTFGEGSIFQTSRAIEMDVSVFEE